MGKSSLRLRFRSPKNYGAKRWLLGIILALVATPGIARAADLGPYDHRAASQPFSWTGFYIGTQVGWVWVRADHSFSNGAPSDSADSDGLILGAYVGYNMQRGQMVFGIEADIEQADARGAFAIPPA